MHKTVILPATLLLAERAGRGLHRFSRFDPSRCVHLVVDMQNAFVQSHSPYGVRAAKSVIPNINRISRGVRASGGLNVFTRWLVSPNATADWPSFFDENDATRALQSTFVPGRTEFELTSDLDVRREDRVIDKTRFSA